ncbi:MAG: hypothetical protein ACPGEG_08930 [Salibacteraceae bacterium]
MKYWIITILLFVSSLGFTQDQVYYANGVKETVQIIKETAEYVIVKEQGEFLKVPTNEIAVIYYKNGTHKVYNKEYAERIKTRKYKVAATKKESNYDADFKRNRIEVNLAAIAFGYAQLSYEFFLAPNVSIKVPLSYGYETGNSVNYVRREYSVGADFLAYVLKPESKIQLYLGPGLDYGSAHMNEEFSDFWSNGLLNPNRDADSPPNGIGFYKDYYSIMVVFGSAMEVANNIELGAEISPGFRQYLGSNGFISLKSDINFNVKFKF